MSTPKHTRSINTTQDNKRNYLHNQITVSQLSILCMLTFPGVFSPPDFRFSTKAETGSMRTGENSEFGAEQFGSRLQQAGRDELQPLRAGA